MNRTKPIVGLGLIALLVATSYVIAQEVTNTDTTLQAKSPPESPTLKFSRVQSSGISSFAGDEICRAKIPGGWLVTAGSSIMEHGGLGLTFVPDPNHKWDGESLAVNADRRVNWQDTEVHVVHLKHFSANDAVRMIPQFLDNEHIPIFSDTENNRIVFRANADVLEKIKKLVEAIDQLEPQKPVPALRK